MKAPLLFLALFCALAIHAQTWKGVVTDPRGDALPFANVYFENTTTGTTTNMKGEFSLTQPAPGPYNLVIQFVGFEKKRISLKDRDPGDKIKVQLNELALNIREVTVAAYKKDPAYYIIRQAQKKRKHYLDQVDSYSCKVYMKGTTRLVEKPGKMPGLLKVSVDDNELDSLKTGLLGLSESINLVYYDKKSGFKEEMTASKVSGQSQSFSWNRASFVLTSFYEDRIKMALLNERGFVSPIAPDALLFYEYKLLGTFEEDGMKVNRIQVTPRRKGDPAFSGIIYITEDLWNIHSLSLTADKNSQIEFVDSINIYQSFTRLGEDVFMPISLQMTYHFGLFGFRANYEAIGSITDYELDREFGDKFFRNEVFSVQDTANKQDSAYWNQVRPVLLSDEEKQNYLEGDSLRLIRESQAYLDSVDKANNKFKPLGLLLSGYDHYNRYDSVRYSLNGLISALQYTAVDGAVIMLSPERNKETARGHHRTSADLRYGFDSRRPGFGLEHNWLFNRKNYSRAYIRAGKITKQINQTEPISPVINSYYSMVEGKNFARFFEKTYLGAGWGREVVNGLWMSIGMEYSDRKNLQNSASWNFAHRRFQENIPAVTDITGNSTQALKLNIYTDIYFKQKYATYPGRKVNLGSAYPVLSIRYQAGRTSGSDAHSWNFAEAEIHDQISLGMIGGGKYSVAVGSFFAGRPLNLVDFRHFTGNQTRFLQMENRPFQTLPYYDFSTNQNYLEAHYEHHFYGFILNKLPLLKKLKLKEVAGVNYLNTKAGKNYLEVYAGIENLFRVIRIDFVSYYRQGQPIKPEVRIGLRIN